MSETGNIERLAKLISQDIFKWFKWDTCLPKDENWQCEVPVHEKNTHPSDVVFYYKDPYSAENKYFNTDLKSYAAGSITKNSLTRALRSLAMSVECANISEVWQKKFPTEDIEFGNVYGLLFIYNHDANYDKNFKDEIDKIDFHHVNIKESNEIIIFGPNTIQRLNDVVNDMKILKSEDLFPAPDKYTFFYPDLIRSRRSGDEWDKPATIELLTSPWFIIKYKMEKQSNSGFVIYYHEPGDTVDEFIYLLDAMSHYQMLSSDFHIRVRFTSASTEAILNFEKAKSSYLKLWGEDEARKIQMQRIDAQTITNFTKSFNPMEIGMREDV